MMTVATLLTMPSPRIAQNQVGALAQLCQEISAALLAGSSEGIAPGACPAMLSRRLSRAAVAALNGLGQEVTEAEHGDPLPES